MYKKEGIENEITYKRNIPKKKSAGHWWCKIKGDISYIKGQAIPETHQAMFPFAKGWGHNHEFDHEVRLDCHFLLCNPIVKTEVSLATNVLTRWNGILTLRLHSIIL